MLYYSRSLFCLILCLFFSFNCLCLGYLIIVCWFGVVFDFVLLVLGLLLALDAPDLYVLLVVLRFLVRDFVVFAVTLFCYLCFVCLVCVDFVYVVLILLFVICLNGWVLLLHRYCLVWVLRSLILFYLCFCLMLAVYGGFDFACAIVWLGCALRYVVLFMFVVMFVVYFVLLAGFRFDCCFTGCLFWRVLLLITLDVFIFDYLLVSRLFVGCLDGCCFFLLVWLGSFVVLIVFGYVGWCWLGLCYLLCLLDCLHLFVLVGTFICVLVSCFG